MIKIIIDLIKKNNHNIESDILEFGVKTIIQFFVGYSCLILVSFLLGVLTETLVVALTSSIIRIFSGGAHATSPLRCTIIGVVVFVSLGFLVKHLYNTNILNYYYILIPIVSIISIIILYKYGYASTHKKLLSSYNHGKKLRSIAAKFLVFWTISGIIMMLANSENYFINNYIISSSFGLIWNMFTLTPDGNKLLNLLDIGLIKIKIN